MPINLWLASATLYRQAVEILMGQQRPDRLPARIALGESLMLHHVVSLDQLPSPEAGQSEVPAVFVDKHYEAIQRAVGLGWRTAWYNPHGGISPERDPIQDVDLINLDSLPQVGIELDKKPSLAECLTWWEEWKVPENIRAHSRTVGRSAYHLAVMLRNKGLCVDPILVHRGGLLHDIDKIDTLKQSGGHGRMGADFLEAQGYPALAEIVQEHIMSTILHPGAADRAWEVKLVYFTDKLVEGDRLVSFERRLEALYERYPHYQETMEQAAGPVRALSDQICSILSIPTHENLISILIKLQNN